MSVLGGRDWSSGRGKLASESQPDYSHYQCLLLLFERGEKEKDTYTLLWRNIDDHCVFINLTIAQPRRLNHIFQGNISIIVYQDKGIGFLGVVGWW